MHQTEERGRYWIERRHRPGYYSDHGLGGEMTWYEEQTELKVVDCETGDIDEIRIEEAGGERRVSWRTHAMTRRLEIGGRGPAIEDHAALADYWLDRLIAARAAYAEA